MKKSVKFLTVLFVVFLMPLAAYSEMWSPDRFRVNFRVGGSTADGSLAPGTMKGKSGGVHLMNADYSDKETDRVNSGTTLQYIMEMGMIVGIHLYSTEAVFLTSQSGDWEGVPAMGATGAGAALLYNSTYGGAGTALGVRKSSSKITFLDLGYLYDMKDIVDGMSVGGGLGLAVGGSTSVDIVYGATGYALNGGLWTESLSDFEGSAMSYFVDFGYAFGIHEALFGLRNVSTSGSATVDETKGIGKVLGKDKFESSGSSMSFFLGYGYIF